jgi:uncharacterized protein (DUF849 family)
MSTSSSHDGKVIITCAITGSIPHPIDVTPTCPSRRTRSSTLRSRPPKLALRSCIFTPGDPETGRPDQRADAFAPFLSCIKQGTDAVVNLTSGGSPFMKIEERIQPSVRFKPEPASFNMGSMNFGLFPQLNRFKEFKHDWERQYLESTRDLVFRNTFRDEFAVTALSANGTRFEFECYDVGHLYNLAHFAERGLIKPPFLVQTVFGILGGIGTHSEDVMHMRRAADRLFGAITAGPYLGAGACKCRSRRWPPP